MSASPLNPSCLHPTPYTKRVDFGTHARLPFSLLGSLNVSLSPVPTVPPPPSLHRFLPHAPFLNLWGGPFPSEREYFRRPGPPGSLLPLIVSFFLRLGITSRSSFRPNIPLPHYLSYLGAPAKSKVIVLSLPLIALYLTPPSGTRPPPHILSAPPE